MEQITTKKITRKPYTKEKQKEKNLEIKINKLEKRYNKLNFTRQPKEHRMAATNYVKALKYPEFADDAKVPGQFGKQTMFKHIHATIPTTANALGNISILFCPYYYHDDSTASTGLLVNNVATYDGVSVFGTGHNGQATPMLTPANNVAEFRLVSASMHIIPQVPLIEAQGKLAGGLTDTQFSAVAVGGNVTTYNTLAIFSNVNNIKPFAEADVCIGECLRLVWRPVDSLDFGMYDLNEIPIQSSYRETLLVAYGRGLPAGMPINIELYWNYEYVPYIGSMNTGGGSYCDSNEDPGSLLRPYMNADQIWAHPFKPANHSHVSYANTVQEMISVPKLTNVSTGGGKLIRADNDFSSLPEFLAGAYRK